MTDDEIIALAHKYIEFDQGKIDGTTFNAELAKCRGHRRTDRRRYRL